MVLAQLKLDPLYTGYTGAKAKKIWENHDSVLQLTPTKAQALYTAWSKDKHVKPKDYPEIFDGLLANPGCMTHDSTTGHRKVSETDLEGQPRAQYFSNGLALLLENPSLPRGLVKDTQSKEIYFCSGTP